MPDEELTEAISLRISKGDRALLQSLAQRLPIKSLAIARIAMRLGLVELTKNPAAILDSSNIARRRKKN